MMNFEEIHRYWQGRATGDDSVQSTTQDVFLREIELRALLEQLNKYCPKRVADFGCGDGRTTIGLARRYSGCEYFGYDYSSAMIENARKVLSAYDLKNVRFDQHDVCDQFDATFDFIYTTRCLINLPSFELQRTAIKNIHSTLGEGGVYVMIENFMEGQDNFNQVRRDFNLSEIPVRSHNYFFTRQDLFEFSRELFDVEFEVNISSTYYLVSRVIYSKICAETGADPDYFDAHHKYAAGLPFSGEFGPVRLICFKKKNGVLR